jgi:hypothetical protein
MSCKGCGRKRSWSSWGHYSGISLEGLIKSTKDLSWYIRFSGRHLNPGPHEYNAEVLTIPSTAPSNLIYYYYYYYPLNFVIIQFLFFISFPLIPYSYGSSLFFSLDLYTIGRTLWTSDRPVARPLPKHRTTQTQNNAHTHTHTKQPCPKWDSNPRTQRPRQRRQFMPQTARLPWPAIIHYRAEWCVCNAVHLYSGGAWFEYQPNYWPFWLKSLDFFSVLQENSEIIPRLGHDCYLPSIFQFIYYSSIQRYII